MKKKLTFIAIFAAVLALSSCVWVDLGDDDVKPATTKTGTLNLSIATAYRNDYYIDKVYIKKNSTFAEVWTASEHPNTYTEGAHVNLTAGSYSEIRVDINTINGSFFETQTIYSVKVPSESSTSRTITPTVQVSVTASLSNSYNNKLYIGTVFIEENGRWKEIWDADDHKSTFLNGASFSLKPGDYNFKIEVYKLRSGSETIDNLWETKLLSKTISNTYNGKKITFDVINPNPGYIKVTIDSEYYNWYYVGDIYIWENNDWKKVWDAKDYPTTYLNGATVALYEGTYDVKFSIYKCRKNGEYSDSFYDNEFEYNVSINAEKDTKFTYGSDGIEKKYW